MQAHVLFPLFLAALLPIHGYRSYPFQNPDANLSGHVSHPSEREQIGLRGTVRSVEEETTYPAQILADGSQIPEMKGWGKTEYDRDGRIVAFRARGSSRGGGYDGTEWVRRYLYGPAGLLLKVTFGKEGEQATEIVNHYDDQGRLQSITDSRRPENPIAFRYDANGRKSRIAAITLYDANDRATEVQLNDPAGALVSRIVRVYDERGNVTDERRTMEDPLKMIPAKAQRDILSKSGMSAQDLRDQLTKLLGARGEMYSFRYNYDKLGRKTQTISTIFNQSDSRTETYNDHGDVANEISQSSQAGTGDEQADKIYSSEVLYSYEYDSIGNWTVKKSSSRTLPDGQPRDSTEVRRTIEYY